MDRRRVIKLGAVAAIAPFINRGRFRVFPALSAEYSARCIKLVQESVVLDMLGPLTIHDKWLEWSRTPSSFTEADYRRYKESGINVFHHAFGMGGYDGVVYPCNAVNTMIAANSNYFVRVDSPEHLCIPRKDRHRGARPPPSACSIPGDERKSERVRLLHTAA